LGAVLDDGRWFTAALLLLSSLISVVYVGQMVYVLLIRTRPEGVERLSEAPLWMVVPTLILAFGNLWFGVVDHRPADIADQASQQLIQEAQP
ncbi:MAG TPA: monovalent cation/H+ antiporter subunit D family protein, partial [Planctomycetota bacterium]|nr:monovalent cation/H+ antiporter subunit D family protein [Planctomycetota bacterium]